MIIALAILGWIFCGCLGWLIIVFIDGEISTLDIKLGVPMSLAFGPATLVSSIAIAAVTFVSKKIGRDRVIYRFGK